MKKTLDDVRAWIKKEVVKAEKAIDKQGPFYSLESRRDTLLEVLEVLDDID